MHAGFLDVLHNSADNGLLAIGNRIDVDLDCFFQKLVDQHRPARRNVDGFVHVARQRRFVVTDFHRAPAEHVAGANEHRIADSRRHLAGPFEVGRRAVGRLQQTAFLQDGLEAFPIFGGIDHFRAGADDLHAGRFQAASQVQRRLTTELHDDAVRLKTVADVEHVFGCQRLEEQDVRGVVVG